ncbi:MAG: hypothetical protein NZ741_11090 [Armatimonadetes bacterium]|nr:hypothetical protein [Armatimonadota bacterium]
MVVEDLHDLIRLLEAHPEWRAELRKVLLGDDLLQLPAVVREIADLQRVYSERHSEEMAQIRATLAEVVRIQQRHSEILERHSEILERHSEEMAQIRTTLAELAEAQRRTSEGLFRLVEWQRGEAGRREGERYEQQTVRRAVSLFQGGEGGSAEQPHVQSLLDRWLSTLPSDKMLDAMRDPSLADIIWWKGQEVLVVEVSQKVNGSDVRRARQRADTLREVGVNATPVVVGEEWATGDTLILAQQEGVEWIVGGSFSAGVLRFRRLRVEAVG